VPGEVRQETSSPGASLFLPDTPDWHPATYRPRFTPLPPFTSFYRKTLGRLQFDLGWLFCPPSIASPILSLTSFSPTCVLHSTCYGHLIERGLQSPISSLFFFHLMAPFYFPFCFCTGPALRMDNALAIDLVHSFVPFCLLVPFSAPLQDHCIPFTLKAGAMLAMALFPAHGHLALRFSPVMVPFSGNSVARSC